MTETDKELHTFFQKGKKEIKDNGFSKKVMRHLPANEHKLVNAWITFCIAAGSILFFSFGGFKAVCNVLREIFAAFLQNEMVNTHPLVIGMLLIATAACGIRKISTLC